MLSILTPVSRLPARAGRPRPVGLSGSVTGRPLGRSDNRREPTAGASPRCEPLPAAGTLRSPILVYRPPAACVEISYSYRWPLRPR